MFNSKIINVVMKQRHVLNIACGLRSQNKILYCQTRFSHGITTISEEDTSYNRLKIKKSIPNPQPMSKKLSERDFLLRLKNDPDSFGAVEEEMQDAGDLEEEKHYTEQPLHSQKLRTKQYADMIKDLIKHRRIKEAIDVVEVRMIKEDRVKPENYIYNLLLGACGRIGYTKKAFSLYNNMKKRGLKVTPGTYTALFNACSNSPWKEDCLTRAIHLRQIMIEKMYEPNVTNYNAMIKAFGRGGDLNTAFVLVDEMISKGINIKDDTINFLLQACVSDIDAGFRHALLVWNKLVTRKIQPSIYTYNLMLRCIRDCGIGDLNTTIDVVKKLTGSNVDNLVELNSLEKCELSSFDTVTDSPKTNLLSNYNSQYDINEEEPVSHESLSTSTNADLPTIHTCDDNSPAPKTFNDSDIYDNLRPNLMADTPHLGSIVSLSEINNPEDRLILVGGLKGFLQNMEQHDCKPDIKTFTQLLDSIPSSIAIEKQLIDHMKANNVKPDLDFYNMLIKKRSMRFDYERGKDVLKFIKKSGYKPNLITYGVLALGCKTKEEALELLDEMQERKYRLNAEILGAMLDQAAHQLNFAYVMEIIEISLKEGIEVNKQFMECLTTFYKRTKHISNDKSNKLYYSKKFTTEYNAFRKRYKTYIQEIKVDDTEEAHPWQQFRQNTETDKYKDKSSTFKPTHKSLFKVKTSQKYKKTKWNPTNDKRPVLIS